MRLFLSALVTALIIPLVAYAQAPKKVEVINDPLAVEVTTPIAIIEPVAVDITEPLAVEVVNPAPPSPPVRWQLVGFTSATYTGAMGGNFGVTQKCQLEFLNSRMCRIEEVAATTSIPSSLVGNAWANPTDWHYPDCRENCYLWKHPQSLCGSFGTGWVVASDGNVADYKASCDSAHPMARCALVP
jgi:hypothetical protein